jgi:hypothetical protein
MRGSPARIALRVLSGQCPAIVDCYREELAYLIDGRPHDEKNRSTETAQRLRGDLRTKESKEGRRNHERCRHLAMEPMSRWATMRQA